MLNKINNLKPFFEDITREYGVREYARANKISPPTSSKLLKELQKESLLKSRHERRNLLFKANQESTIFKDLMILYNKRRIEESGLLDYLEKKFNYPTIVLLGSFAKAENIPESDIDLCIIAMDKKEADIKKFEEILKHTIHMIVFSSLEDIKNRNLLENVLNGIVLRGNIRLGEKNGP